jgi:integral membrane protein (TIGR01906 family)
MKSANNIPQVPQKSTSPLFRILSWLVTLLAPVPLTLTAVRLLLTPLYVQNEYKMPGFPIDSYGFTTEERLYYGNNARQYLINSAGISYLGDLSFENGQPVYNARELSHMVDVKNTVTAALNVWYGSLIVLAVLGVWAWLGGWRKEYKRGLGRGGWLTVILLGTIVLLVMLSFGLVFVAFHNVFFAAGTWTFEYSDTLIRLFPERFWRDIFLLVGGLTLAGGLVLGLLFGRRTE